MLNAWEREEGVLCVCLAWKFIWCLCGGSFDTRDSSTLGGRVRGGWLASGGSVCPLGLGVRVGRVAVVEHELVAVGVGEDRHVADAGVERLAEERHALGLQLGAGRVDVLHA